jgi:hypothetical protein
MKDLPVLLDRLEQAGGLAGPVPSADGWELVLAENVAYLVDEQRRWQAMAKLRTEVGLVPEQILAAPEDVLLGIVAGSRPAERVQRLLPAGPGRGWRARARDGACPPARPPAAAPPWATHLPAQGPVLPDLPHQR